MSLLFMTLLGISPMRRACRITLRVCALVVLLCQVVQADDLVRQLRLPVDAVWIVPGQVLLTGNSRVAPVGSLWSLPVCLGTRGFS